MQVIVYKQAFRHLFVFCLIINLSNNNRLQAQWLGLKVVCRSDYITESSVLKLVNFRVIGSQYCCYGSVVKNKNKGKSEDQLLAVALLM